MNVEELRKQIDALLIAKNTIPLMDFMRRRDDIVYQALKSISRYMVFRDDWAKELLRLYDDR